MKRTSFLRLGLFGLAAALSLLSPLAAFALGEGDDLREVSRQQREESELHTPEAVPGYQPVLFSPITPELAVPIPGIEFSPPTEDGDDIVVPFLAQYISGIYRYLLGIATLVAIIVVIAGGFMYLLGQTTGSAQTGLTLIKDAIAGLVVLYASYLILWTVNPNLVNLQPIRLTRIQSVPLGEDAGQDGDFSDVPPNPDGGEDGSGSMCSLSYNQGQSPWNSLPYGGSSALIVGSTDTRTVCSDHALTNGSSCFGTFAESACGPTAVASVLAFYGLQVSVSGRAPAPGNAFHLVDPIDVAIFAIKKGYRIIGRGTTGRVMSDADSGFPLFQARTITKTNTAEILRVLRAGTPLAFSCKSVRLFSDDAATQRILNRRGSDRLYSPGHYMVLSGVVNDQILRVHDVGRRSTKTIRMQDLQQSCGSPVEIKPRPGATGTISTTWGTGSGAITVQMRLPAQPAGRCQTSGGQAGGAAAATSGVFSVPFTYRPEGQPATAWPDGSARILLPTRLRSATSQPRVRVFIYLHGNNDGNRTPEDRYLPYLQRALERVAGTKDIVVMTPHHNEAGDRYPGFNLADFYGVGMRALQSALPGATAVDVVVGAHSGATCGTSPVILQALSSPLPGTRGVIAYDGCLGDDLTPENATGAGISLYLNPDTAGMGNEDPRDVTGNERRNAIVRRAWSLGSHACPACVASSGANAQCYGQSASFARPGGGELISFETSAGHGPSVEAMTNIAFCAFYR